MNKSVYMPLGLLALSAAPALAANQAQTRVIGSLDQACTVTAPPDQTISVTSTGVQSIGSPGYQCNFSGNATLRFWTQNGGAIVAPAASSNNNVARPVNYSFTFDGTALGKLTDASSTATAVTRAIATPNTAQNGAATIQLANSASIAGTYSDTIYVSIAP